MKQWIIILAVLAILVYYFGFYRANLWESKASYSTDPNKIIVLHISKSASSYLYSGTQIFQVLLEGIPSGDISEADCLKIGTPSYQSGYYYKCNPDASKLKPYNGGGTCSNSYYGLLETWNYDQLSYSGSNNIFTITPPACGRENWGTTTHTIDVWYYFPELMSTTTTVPGATTTIPITPPNPPTNLWELISSTIIAWLKSIFSWLKL